MAIENRKAKIVAVKNYTCLRFGVKLEKFEIIQREVITRTLRSHSKNVRNHITHTHMD